MRGRKAIFTVTFLPLPTAAVGYQRKRVKRVQGPPQENCLCPTAGTRQPFERFVRFVQGAPPRCMYLNVSDTPSSSVRFGIVLFRNQKGLGLHSLFICFYLLWSEVLYIA